MWKFSKLLFLSVILGLFLAVPSSTFAASLSLTPTSGNANRGCTLTLQVMLDTEGQSSDGTDATIKYDPTRFTVASSDVTPGSIYPEYPGISVSSNPPGSLTISGVTTGTTPFNGKGIFATINFKVPENAPAGSTDITFDFDPNDKTKTNDSNVASRAPDVVDILSSVVNGKYTVGTGTCTVTAPGTAIPRGQFVSTPSSSTPIPTFTPTPVPTKPVALPNSALEGPTLLLVIVGGGLTLLGIAGLLLL